MDARTPSVFPARNALALAASAEPRDAGQVCEADGSAALWCWKSEISRSKGYIISRRNCHD
jgi:hypothetical protein